MVEEVCPSCKTGVMMATDAASVDPPGVVHLCSLCNFRVIYKGEYPKITFEKLETKIVPEDDGGEEEKAG